MKIAAKEKSPCFPNSTISSSISGCSVSERGRKAYMNAATYLKKLHLRAHQIEHSLSVCGLLI